MAFVRSLSLSERSNGGGGAAARPQPKVVDSISCRQLYLRSYTFSRDDDEELNKGMRKRSCLRFRERVADYRRNNKHRGGGGGSRGRSGGGGRRKKCRGFTKAVKDMSCVAFSSIFRRLLSCTTKVDVVG